MNESKENRISKLEERRAIANRKVSYCDCTCHEKTLGDFFEITDEYAEEVWRIVEDFGKFQLPDGTWKSHADDLLERNANRQKCTCKCTH